MTVARFFFIAIVFLGISRLHAQSTAIQWMDLNEAFAKDSLEPRPIMIDFYTNWCGNCKKMDLTTFADSAVIAYMNENFYNVRFNAESKDTIVFAGVTYYPGGTEKNRRKYHQFAYEQLENQMAFPTFIFYPIDDIKNQTLGYLTILQWKSLVKQIYSFR